MTVAAACLALGSFAMTGCSSSTNAPKVAPVSGAVTLDGKPLPSGEIIFTAEGYGTIVPIIDGAYKGEASIGLNRVQIFSYREGGKAVMMGGEKFGGEKENFIPARFNADSKLTADVKEGGPNENKFEVLSK